MNAFAMSTAVMARRVEPADSLDYFPTPPWSTRAFCRHVLPVVWPWPDLFDHTACDPACGEGHMALALQDHFTTVHAADIFEYGFGRVADFRHPEWGEQTGFGRPDWIITNPPFNLAVEFVELALSRARRGVAMLARTALQEGQERYRQLFKRRPPQLVAQYVERVPMHRGRWVINGKTATAYQWFVWRSSPPHDWVDTRLMWIPPSKSLLSRHDDWLRFSGSQQPPEKHPIWALMKKAQMKTIAEVRQAAEKRAEDSRPATLGDIREQLERLL